MAHLFFDSECYVQKEDGCYVPIYDTKHAKLICIREEKRKKSIFFNLEQASIEEVRDWFDKKIDAEAKRKRPTTIWCHNWNYDISVLARGLMHNEERFKPIAYKPFIWEYITPSGNHARLIDTMNFYNMSLENVGKIVGNNKGVMPKVVWSIEQIKPYCEQDVRIVEEAVSLLKISMGELGYLPKKWSSAPRLAYNFLQKICEEQFITKNDGSKHSYYSYLWWKGRIHQTGEPEFLRMLSRGGHLELYTEHAGIVQDVYKLDINSSYPFICSTKPFPDLLSEKVIEKPTLEVLDMLGGVEATVKAPKTAVPYLPIRYNRKVVYPIDRVMKGFWTLHELKNAIEEYGYELLELHKAVVYKPLPFNPFKVFMEQLYTIKSENRRGMKHVAKLLMNSLTGKFAQRMSKEDRRTIHRRELQSYNAQGYSFVAEIEGTPNIIVSKELQAKAYSRTSNPIMYAYITAYARTYLYEHLRKIPIEDLLYCATDSIVFRNKEHLKHFDINDELGGWKIEAEGEEAEFFKTECYYRVGNDIKASGVRKRDVTLAGLRGEEALTTKAMFTAKMGWKTGEFDKVGTFIDKPINLKGIPKRSIKLPSYIEENTPSQMKSMFEEALL